MTDSDSYGGGYTSVQPWNTLPAGSAAQNGAYQRDVDSGSGHESSYHSSTAVVGSVSYAPNYGSTSSSYSGGGGGSGGGLETIGAGIGIFLLLGFVATYSDTALLIGFGLLTCGCLQKYGADFGIDEWKVGIPALAVVGVSGWVAYSRFNSSSPDVPITNAVIAGRNGIIIATIAAISSYIFVRDRIHGRYSWMTRLKLAAAIVIGGCGLYASARLEPSFSGRAAVGLSKVQAASSGYARTNDKFDSKLASGETIHWRAGATVRLLACSDSLCTIGATDQNGSAITARVNRKVLDLN